MESARKVSIYKRIHSFLGDTASIANTTAKAGSVVAVVAPTVGIPATMVAKLVAVGAESIATLVETLKAEQSNDEALAVAASLALHSAFFKAVEMHVEDSWFSFEQHVEDSWFSFEKLDPDNQETRLEITAELLYQVNHQGELFNPAYKLLEDQLERVLWPYILDTNEANFKACLAQVKADAQIQYNLLIQGQPDWVRDYFGHRERDEILNRVKDIQQGLEETSRRLVLSTSNAVPPSAGSGFSVATASNQADGFIAERLAFIYRKSSDAPQPNSANILATAYAVSDLLLLSTALPDERDDADESALAAAFLLPKQKGWVCAGVTQKTTGESSSVRLYELKQAVPFTSVAPHRWVTSTSSDEIPFCVHAFIDGSRSSGPNKLLSGSFVVAEDDPIRMVSTIASPALNEDQWWQFAGAPCFVAGGLVGFFRRARSPHDMAEPGIGLADLLQKGPVNRNDFIELTAALPTDAQVLAWLPTGSITVQETNGTIIIQPFSNEALRRQENQEKIEAVFVSLPQQTKESFAAQLSNKPHAVSIKPRELTHALLALPLQDQIVTCHQVYLHEKQHQSRPEQKDPWLTLLAHLLLHDLDEHWGGVLEQLADHQKRKAGSQTKRQGVKEARQVYLLKAALLHAARQKVSFRLSLVQSDSYALANVTNGVVTSHFFESEPGIVDPITQRHAAVDQLLYQVYRKMQPDAHFMQGDIWYYEGISEEDKDTVRHAFKRRLEMLKKNEVLVPFVLFDMVQGVFDFETMCLLQDVLPDYAIFQDDGLLRRHRILRTDPGYYAEDLINFLKDLYP